MTVHERSEAIALCDKIIELLEDLVGKYSMLRRTSSCTDAIQTARDLRESIGKVKPAGKPAE